MHLKQAVTAKLRDPWFVVAVALTFLAPLAAIVYAFVTRSIFRQAEPYEVLLTTAGPAVNLLPMLVFFLVAASPESSTRRAFLEDYLADVAMLGTAFLVGWGAPSLFLISVFDADAFSFVALAVFLVEVLVLLAAWRAVAAAIDAPGLDSGALHRRLFLGWLVLSALVPTVATLANTAWRVQEGPFTPPMWMVLLYGASPKAAFDALGGSTFPQSMLNAQGHDATWFTPIAFAPVLLAWIIVPLLVALRRFPEDAPPAAPPPDESPSP